MFLWVIKLFMQQQNIEQPVAAQNDLRIEISRELVCSWNILAILWYADRSAQRNAA